MRTIGLLGGMSWESSAEYYRLANQMVHQRLGGHHSAKLVLVSVDFAEIEALQAAGEWHRAGRLLAGCATRLESAGAEVVVLCTNTMHRVADQIQAAVTIPLLHIADPTAAAIREIGLRRIGLLATAFTMDLAFYRDRLAAHGIEVLVPEATDRATVHRIVYDELVHGIVRAPSRTAYRAVIERLVAAGAEGIVLGCTEIELLVSRDDCPVPSFPTTYLHVLAAVDYALR